MGTLRLAVNCAFPVVMGLVCVAAATTCRRRFVGGGRDCGTRTDICTVGDVNGPDLNSVPFPSENRYICYRTCYENGQDGNCIATQRFNERNINVYASNDDYVAMKFSSPRHRNDDGSIGNYRKSSICRYHVKCSGTKRLFYAINQQNMQDTATCNGMPQVCVDRIRMIFPGVGECDRCSSLNNQMNANCMDRSGLGQAMMVEFVVNRETDRKGFEILASCLEPGFNLNNVPGPIIGKRQVASSCTSPLGMGPTPFPELPPNASRIERVLTEDPNALYFVLEEPEDVVTYNDYILTIQISQEEPQVFPNISVLEVENPLDVRRYYRIAPGFFSGLAQLVISGDSAVLVQFGVNPNLLPSPEEATIASLLDASIADAVADQEQFDVLDAMDLLEQADELRIIAPNITESRKKRGIEPGFVDELALEYGNACNGVLRASACVYQQVLLGISCT